VLSQAWRNRMGRESNRGVEFDGETRQLLLPERLRGQERGRRIGSTPRRLYSLSPSAHCAAAALEAAVMASEEIARKRDEVLAALQRDLEAARYSANRAQKRYDAAEPENRLIAAELGRRWDQALQRVHAIENQIARHTRGQGMVVAPTREELEQLASKLQMAGESSDVEMRVKKRGLLTGHGNRWTRDHVTALRSYHQIPRPLCRCSSS
jgi:DNA repair exonuclease SbcCD ATPase subunit